MIDTVLNLLFRCSHRRLSRPVSPAAKKGVSQGPAYVVCLDCGKHFAYDTRHMRLGKRLDDPEAVMIAEPAAANSKPPASKLKYALWASLPVAVLLGSILKTRKAPQPAEAKKPEESRNPVEPR